MLKLNYLKALIEGFYFLSDFIWCTVTLEYAELSLFFWLDYWVVMEVLAGS